MTVMALIEVRIKPEVIDEFKSAIKRLLPDTRSYDGCQGVDVYVNEDNPGNLVFVGYWDSPEHHKRYRAWRAESGIGEQLGAMFAAPPGVRYFQRVDV